MVLAAIGLDERQEAAYRTLVALGAADVADLAHRLGLPEADTERVLRRLESRGLAAGSSARAGRWVAAPPEVALGALLTRQRHELERAEEAATRLAEEYRAEEAKTAVPDLVEVVTGAAAVERRRDQLLLGAREEVCALLARGPLAVPARGVACRVVVEREVLSRPGGAAALAAALGGEVRLRVADRVPARLLVADRAVGMVPLTGPGAQPVALVARASGLLETLTALFEAVWRDALPLRLGQGGEAAEDAPAGPDATDLEVLSLLLAGLTDASVAKQLDLGLRTVQRRVKGLMELAGVTTRLQLGWYAHERGWVTRV